MTAKHKRPFFVFTAVAVVCGMVLITGVRSKADMSRGPDVFSATVATAGPPISPLPELSDSTTISPAPEADTDGRAHSPAAPESRDSGEFEAPPAGDGNAGPTGSYSGVIVMPPLTIPSGPDDVEVPGIAPEPRPPDDGDKSKGGKNGGTRGKGGKHGNKDDKDEGVNGSGLPGQHLDDVDLPEDKDSRTRTRD